MKAKRNAATTANPKLNVRAKHIHELQQIERFLDFGARRSPFYKQLIQDLITYLEHYDVTHRYEDVTQGEIIQCIKFFHSIAPNKGLATQAIPAVMSVADLHALGAKLQQTRKSIRKPARFRLYSFVS